MKILHFSDAHLDHAMARGGRIDPVTGLPVRVMDYLAALDQIVDAALEKEVDLVLFTGDAYSTSNPSSLVRQEFHKRILRLALVGEDLNIPVILLTGNHDTGRMNSMYEFTSLNIPNVYVVDTPVILGLYEPAVDIICIPWVNKRKLLVRYGFDADLEISAILTELVDHWISETDSDRPLILAAHGSVLGATYGSEQAVTFGIDFILPDSIIQQNRFAYVALGHLHQFQSLYHEALYPDSSNMRGVYSGSIERIDWSEANQKKYYVIAEIGDQGNLEDITWHEIENLRPWVLTEWSSKYQTPTEASMITMMTGIMKVLPRPQVIKDAICRLVLEFDEDQASFIDDPVIRAHYAEALEFTLVKKPRRKETAGRLTERQQQTLNPKELLGVYLSQQGYSTQDKVNLANLAYQIMEE